MFRKWHGYTVEMRNREIYEEQGRMLLYANQKKTEYEEVLQRQLDEERQKQIHLQTKCSNMSLEMEILQDKIATYQQSRTQNQQMEMELASRLKEEQDKNVILNAKYNSLVSKTERERIEWMDKLHRLELMSNSAPTKRETSIMTSMDFGSPLRKPSGNKSVLLSLLPREFLSRDYDEDSLLHLAENRVTNKNSKEVSSNEQNIILYYHKFFEN